MLLGQKSQSQVTKIVYQAAGAGGVNQARTIAAVAVGLTSTATACRTKHERWRPRSALDRLSRVPQSAVGAVGSLFKRKGDDEKPESDPAAKDELHELVLPWFRFEAWQTPRVELLAREQKPLQRVNPFPSAPEPLRCRQRTDLDHCAHCLGIEFKRVSYNAR
jgi:hypothetical protein